MENFSTIFLSNLDWNQASESYPASYPGVLSVAAVDYKVSSGRVDKSNTRFSNRNTEIDVCSDGFDV